MRRFVRALLERPEANLFLHDFRLFQRRVAYCGLYNSFSQCLVKLTAPGVPDLYQGKELWDLSLVDTDNRRPVDYARRRAWLAELERAFDPANQGWGTRYARALLNTLEDGRAKLFLTWKALTLRRAHPQLFTRGAYLPLAAGGRHAAHLIAYARAGTMTSAWSPSRRGGSGA